MADFTSSVQMSLPIPNVSVAPGPEWATLLNACLTIVDGHTHTPGSGIAITPNGLNINSDLTMANNNLINLRTTRFTVNASPLGAASDLSCQYSAGTDGDLYWNDALGNQIRLTQSGSIVGTSGSISGLPSGTASAVYTGVGATFVWQSATNVAASLDARNVILRNSSVSSFGLTLQPPAAMGANFAVTLPNLPASARALSIDASGIMATGVAGTVQTVDIADANVTRPKLASVGQQISSSSGSYTTASNSFVDVTNLSVTITTTGRPVFIGLIGDGSTSLCEIRADDGSQSSAQAYIQFVQGATAIYQANILWTYGGASATSAIAAPPSAFSYYDLPAAGTYTYKVQTKAGSNDTVSVTNVKLIAFELA